ncbi:MAG: flagellar motor switch protein FliN [Deltaproteobacteria bacterium]|jgi:flagellar motor switch protein FliN|nr:flagellar motor switch protein FliN [Deltaproteobacteria bacterium]MBT4091000.1 flagellar motor switch protein FliN [Deltaproteobacteria bacterium]MBT4269313.1 flagellar motor switch protein FliN [Deltaproteobacteria bacterium]MBT4643249.1 flagellar motor switch protein FliN [Deltaproteobacteria bacterium]MBT6498534.1 flagellar motor switch protein FliN [Deltaproteobacteria bacterium]
MADKEDPFAAAMASMDGDDADQTEPGKAADDASASGDLNVDGDDAFDAAMQAMEAVSESPTSGPVDPFEMATQAMGSGGNVNTATVETDAGDDPFAAALEVAKAEHKVAEAQRTDDSDGKELDIDFLMEIKLNLTFEVGRTKMYISDLLSLGQGSVIELHRLVGEELELYVNGQLLATGEVVVVNEKFGARVSRILTPEERIAHLGPQIVF